MESTSQLVVLLGASPKQDRYSNMAFHRLQEAGHQVIPVNPAYQEIEGTPAVPTVAKAAEAAGKTPIDTITIYLSPKYLNPMVDDIIGLNPRRVIFNPGTESQAVQDKLDAAGIPWMEACTLVLLSTGQFA